MRWVPVESMRIRKHDGVVTPRAENENKINQLRHNAKPPTKNLLLSWACTSINFNRSQGTYGMRASGRHQTGSEACNAHEFIGARSAMLGEAHIADGITEMLARGQI